MLELKTKQQLARDAHTMAKSFALVRHRGVTYVPADYEARDPLSPPLDEERKIWLPLRRDELRQLAAIQYQTLFATEAELNSFDFMVAQNAAREDAAATSLLVRTPTGLRELGPAGELAPPSGKFVPNTLHPLLNDDPADQAEVYQTLVEWVASEAEADSLLAHLATSLAPHWSAVKYVLLLGEGRNGKSVLMKMLQAVFGPENVSHVTRQHIAEQSPVVLELNGRLMNIIYDGRAEYLKDSGTEKSLIAGEPVPIRRLYESNPTLVQTNALFVEGLNREPKSSDKSAALQKRLVRFQFPNVYPLNPAFERRMLSERYLGAFLALLVEHYVKEDEAAARLAPTAKAVELQLEHMFHNSIGLQYLKHLEETDALGAAGVVGEPISALAQGFQSWRVKENDLGTWSEPDVVQLLLPLVATERRSVRVHGQPRKVRVVTALKEEALQFINSMKGDEEDDATIP